MRINSSVRFCGREPPSGVDVKACPNCGKTIPTVAYYCSVCGASQKLAS